MSEESDRMMVLLQELAALKTVNPEDRLAARKRRREISKEMKELAARKKMEETA